METDDLMKTAAVAERLGVDRTTVTRWMKRGVLTPAVIVPGYRGDYLFRIADVEALAAEREQRVEQAS